MHETTNRIYEVRAKIRIMLEFVKHAQEVWFQILENLLHFAGHRLGIPT